MRYTHTAVSVIRVIGYIWYPRVVCGHCFTLSALDRKELGEWTRENVAKWLATHSGDFSEVTDFCADFSLGDRDWVSDWENEDSDIIYSDEVDAC